MASLLTQEALDDMLAQELRDFKLTGMGDDQACRRLPLAFAALSHLSLAGRPAHPVHVGRVKLDVMIAAPELLSLSDDELQLVHESMPEDALWSCVRCCKRLRKAALASGGLAVVAALAGDLASVRWAHLRGCPVSRVGAGKLCHIAAARNDLPMLRWTLANGGVGLHGAIVMELAIAAGNLDMVRVAHDHGCELGRDYETAAIMGHLEAKMRFLRDLPHVLGGPVGP